ncbi:MAG: nucleotidyltransferase domain-containing protein [Flavobacteriales bacterium]|nr:nucleotidyltransferase domain-containing protein [Flavobacteriales bacterium]
MNALLQNHLQEINAICENNGVKALYLFGSAAANELSDTSDVDFAVVFKEELEPLERGDAYFEVLSALEKLLKRRIDLVSYSVIKNPIFKEEVDRTKVSLYAAA